MSRRAPTESTGLWLVRLLVWMVWLWGTSAWNQEFQFFLRNGDRLTGAVVAEDSTTIIITNSLLGRFRIPASQLERRERFTQPAVATTPPPAPKPPAEPVRPTTLSPTPLQKKRLEELVQVYMGGQITAAEFQQRRAALLAPPRPPGPKRWTGEVFAGFDAGIGAKNRQFFTGRFKLGYANKHVRNAFDYLFTYGHTEGELTANRMDTSDKLDMRLDERYYLYVLAGGGYDRIRRIDHYFQTGPGVGKHLIQRTNFVLNGEAGVNYQVQNFEDGRDPYLFYYRLAQDSKWVINSKLSLDQKLEYTPQWDDFSQFKVRGEANFRYLLRDNLSLNLTVIDLYDTRVAKGISPNDLQIRSSVGLKF